MDKMALAQVNNNNINCQLLIVNGKCSSRPSTAQLVVLFQYFMKKAHSLSKANHNYEHSNFKLNSTISHLFFAAHLECEWEQDN